MRCLAIMEAADRTEYDFAALAAFAASVLAGSVAGHRPIIAAFVDLVRLRPCKGFMWDGSVACWERLCEAYHMPQDLWVDLCREKIDPTVLPDSLERRLGVRVTCIGSGSRRGSGGEPVQRADEARARQPPPA